MKKYNTKQSSLASGVNGRSIWRIAANFCIHEPWCMYTPNFGMIGAPRSMYIYFVWSI